MKKNQIVQVINPEHHWYASLVVVSEVKSWGIQGYLTIPQQGQAFIRLKNKDIEIVGQAVIVAQECDEED